MVQPSRQQTGTPSLGPVKRFGRFTLVKKLATGGMAEIWLARQSGLAGFNRFVVIKKILSHLAEEDTFVKMFLDEARMSSQLMHPNIVQVYDLGEAEGTYFIAMEYIAGENLAAIAWRGVKRRSPLSPPFAARIIADSSKALHYAHHLKGSDGIPLELVHRDISPQNILVTYDGEIKVVDFGIAKAASKSQHTKTGMLKGKFSYMSPEQCLGSDVDLRSDVFALGIVLYELCTGKRLFKHESELMILEMITKRRITPPSEVAPDIAPELEGIIMRALEKDRTSRYQNTQDLQIALEDYLRSESAAATNADIATFMRDLFGDKIEEKRKLIELASRDELIAAAMEDESTESGDAGSADGQKRRVVYGRPSDIRVSGVASGPQQTPAMMPPGATAGGVPMGQPHPNMGTPIAYPMAHPGMSHPGMMYPGMSHPGMSHPGMVHPGQMYPGPGYQQTSNWVPRAVIFGAAMIILCAGGYLAWEIVGVGQPPERVEAPRAQTGWVQIDSEPRGAQIWVDGKEVKLEGGDVARTPIEQLSPLDYNRRYEVRLIKEGYEPYVLRIDMDHLTHGRSFKPALVGFPGKLIAEVRGETRSAIIKVNGESKGEGDRLEISHPPGRLTLAAEARGLICTPDRSTLELRPGGTERVTFDCKAKGVPPPPPPPRPDAGRPPPPPPPTGCAPLPDQPPGYVTIATVPFSEIWYQGKKLGDTPLNKEKLPAGCIELRAIHPGPPPKEKKVQVKVESNRTLRYRFEL